MWIQGITEIDDWRIVNYPITTDRRMYAQCKNKINIQNDENGEVCHVAFRILKAAYFIVYGKFVFI